MELISLGTDVSVMIEAHNIGAPREEISETETLIGTFLPQEYKDIVVKANGFRGWTQTQKANDSRYISLYSLEEVRSSFKVLELDQYDLKTIVIGSSGGGEAYTWQFAPTAEKPWIRTHFEEIGPSDDRLELRYKTLSDLFAHLTDDYK